MIYRFLFYVILRELNDWFLDRYSLTSSLGANHVKPTDERFYEAKTWLTT